MSHSDTPDAHGSPVPVTPGFPVGDRSAYVEDVEGRRASGNPHPSPESRRVAPPAEPTNGTSAGDDILKRILEDGQTNGYFDPKLSEHPTVNLSGRMISALFCIPYDVGYKPSSKWELKPRRGTSALYDSIAYLNSPKSPWNHTLVGWTGEIRQLADDPGGQSGVPNSLLSSNKASAPIPVDANQRLPEPGQPEFLRITKEDRDRLEAQLTGSDRASTVPVWLLDDDHQDPDGDFVVHDQSRWRRYAEHELYTLFHYKLNQPDDGRGVRKAWADYYRLNRSFADKIVDIYKPGDIIIVHDYNLLLLPSLLRQRIPGVYIGFYLHVPFPSSEFYRCLSRRKELLEGVLGANMIGFQSYSYSRHFASCCTRILGFESSSAGVDAYGAHVATEVFPIGIDAEKVENMAFGDSVIDEAVRRIKEMYVGKKIIVGRDRLDAAKGVTQKLQAFHTFLERYPEWRDKVVLIQITSSSSKDMRTDDEETTMVNKIADLVTSINGRYGSLRFSPVQHFPQYVPKEEYFALLRAADLGLITSVRDGINTTSLEYVVCQKDNHGPLILSEFSGTAGSLSDAINVNPWDFLGVADAIAYALSMGQKEREEQHEKLYTHVKTNSVRSWTDRFIFRLVTNLASFDQSNATPALDRAKLLTQYRSSKKRLFMFDYDGTLVNIVQSPSAAIPSDRVIRSLKTLASDPMNEVWIISGRDQAFLDEWWGHISELGLSAEHGSFLRQPRSDDWVNLAAEMDMGWQQEVIDVFQEFTERTQGSFIERKKIAVTWHYRRADPEFGLFQARECQELLESTVARKWDIEVMSGKANLEVRPRFLNKGIIAKRLVEQYRGNPAQQPDFVLCLGDDFTDEDMFRSLKDCRLPSNQVFSCTVGASSKQTLASWHLLEPSDVISVVQLLNGSADAGNVGAVAVVDGQIPENR